jgi:cysteine desulfurase
MSLIYLDNNATTRIYPEVLEEMMPWLTHQYGNPSSSHGLGKSAKEALVMSRASIAKFLHASPAEVIFTSGATESNHLAIASALLNRPGRRRIVSSAVEHPSTLSFLVHLSKQGYDVVLLPVDSTGNIDLTKLADVINDQTALVSFMHANNETGVIFPIAEIAEIAHAHGALMHTDAAQTVGKLMLDVQVLGCDFLSFSGHKLHAAKGVGALYVKKGIQIQSMLFGHQERARRGGTENLSGIVGMAKACAMAQLRQHEHVQHLSALRDLLEQSILEQVADAYINGGALRVPNTSNICFKGFDGEEMLYRLERLGVMASRGSACTASGTEPSHVLLAMGCSRDEALASLRFSLSYETTVSEIEATVSAVYQVLNEMKLPTAA